MARKKGAYVLFFSKLDEHIPKWMFLPIFAQSYFHFTHFLRQSLIIDHQKYAKVRLAIKVRKKKNWCRAEEEKCGGNDDDGGDSCNCGCYHNRNVIVDYFDERVSGNG